jgi:methylmalonyl-CoA/ethylmalonyl-CoA epimerase
VRIEIFFHFVSENINFAVEFQKQNMDISHIEHIGIAVKNLEEQLAYYENTLGLKCYNVEVIEDQKVKTAFFKVGRTKIELLEPTCEESTIAKFIEKRGEGIHHIAFAVPCVQTALDKAESKGIQLIDKTPRTGAEGLQIAFLHPKSTGGVLTEFCMPGDLSSLSL